MAQNKYKDVFKDKRFRKPAIITGLAMFVVWVMYSLFSGPPEQHLVGANAAGTEMTRKAKDGLTTDNPELLRQSREHAAVKASDAEKKGQSAVSIPMVSPERVSNPVVPQLPDKKLDSQPLANPPLAVDPRTQRTERLDRPVEARNEELEAAVFAHIMKASDISLPKPGAVSVSVAYLSKKAAEEDAEKIRQKELQQAAVTSKKDEGKPEALRITPGKILYAMTITASDSDQSGTPVTAKVISGEFRDARFIGSFQRQDERLVIKFTKCVIGDRTFSVEAYAVDPSTSLPAVRSSVDTHFLARWGGLVASSFLEGFGRAISQGGTTTTTAYGTTSSMPRLNTQDQLWSAAGVVGQRAGQHFSKNFDIPPTVSLKKDTEIGILVI